MARNSSGVGFDWIGVADHSLAKWDDTTQAVRVKGTVVEFHRINPHSVILLEQKTTDGLIRRWGLLQGPSGLQLNRKDFPAGC